MDASIWVMFISKNRDTLEIAEHSLFNSPIIIRCCGFHFRSNDLTNPIHRIPGQFVNALTGFLTFSNGDKKNWFLDDLLKSYIHL